MNENMIRELKEKLKGQEINADVFDLVGVVPCSQCCSSKNGGRKSDR